MVVIFPTSIVTSSIYISALGIQCEFEKNDIYLCLCVGDFQVELEI